MSVPPEPSFDRYARDYEAVLDRGLSLTGESRDYYAHRRVEVVREACARLGLRPRTVCDYGCGTGATASCSGGRASLPSHWMTIWYSP